LVFGRDARVPRDVDIDDNGLVNSQDVNLVKNIYRSESGNSSYQAGKDINNNNIIDIIDIVKVGFEFNSR